MFQGKKEKCQSSSLEKGTTLEFVSSLRIEWLQHIPLCCKLAKKYSSLSKLKFNCSCVCRSVALMDLYFFIFWREVLGKLEWHDLSKSPVRSKHYLAHSNHELGSFWWWLLQILYGIYPGLASCSLFQLTILSTRRQSVQNKCVRERKGFFSSHGV